MSIYTVQTVIELPFKIRYQKLCKKYNKYKSFRTGGYTYKASKRMAGLDGFEDFIECVALFTTDGSLTEASAIMLASIKSIIGEKPQPNPELHLVSSY